MGSSVGSSVGGSETCSGGGATGSVAVGSTDGAGSSADSGVNLMQV